MGLSKHIDNNNGYYHINNGKCNYLNVLNLNVQALNVASQWILFHNNLLKWLDFQYCKQL